MSCAAARTPLETHGTFGSPDPVVSCYPAESTAKSSYIESYVQSLISDAPGYVLSWIMVGRGEVGVNCGVPVATKGCDNPDCGKIYYVRHKCRRRACPTCYKGWIYEESTKITARLLSYESIKRNKGKRLVHLILSPDGPFAPGTREELRALFNDGYKYLKEKGVEGGALVFHAFRTTKDAKRKAKAAHMKKWAWIRKQENYERYIVYSPHMHCICFVGHLKKPEEGEKWIYKTITNEKNNNRLYA